MALILNDDEEQFREAMIICENRGLLLAEEKGKALVSASPARETKPRETQKIS